MARFSEALEAKLVGQACTDRGFPIPDLQYPGAVPGRKFRLDYAWPEYRLCIERDGGLFGQKGKKAHSSPSARFAQMERDALLQLNGWNVYHFAPAVTRPMSAKTPQHVLKAQKKMQIMSDFFWAVLEHHLKCTHK